MPPFANSMASIFNLPTEKQQPKADVLPPEHQSDIENDLDYQYARGNFIDIMTTNQNAIVSLAKIAQQSESPRAYEVLAKLIETGTKTNKDFVELKGIAADSSRKVKNEKAPSTVNNNLVISTKDLQKMLKGTTKND